MCREEFKCFLSTIWKNVPVRRYCLDLQEKYAVTVTIVLYAKWCDVRGYYFDTNSIAVARNFEQKYIYPVRKRRKILKNTQGYGEALSKELALEMRMIDVIFDTFPATKIPEMGKRESGEKTPALQALSKCLNLTIRV